MRLLLANPNTTEAVTTLVADAARRCAPAGVEIRAATARFGARIIGTPAELAVAEHAALDLLAREAGGCDAVIVAASTDSGVAAGRSLLDVPVLGLTQSALHAACLTGARFGAVTLGGSTAGLRDLIDREGLTGRCAGLRAVPLTPQDVLAAPEHAAGPLAAAAATLDDADVIVLVGAVLAGLAGPVAARLAVPVLEGVSCAVMLAVALASLRGGHRRSPSGRAVVGIDPALAALMQG